MLEIIPEKLKRLAAVCPAPLYAVGGACRDYIAGLRSDRIDWDICAPARADEVALAAQAAGLQVKTCYPLTGSLKLSDGDSLYEFTSFRTDIYGGRGHRPTAVAFTDDIAVDALRRDFKCNAVYYDISGGVFVDPLGGINDIKNKKITPVAPPEKLFSEDALRIMRLARFCGELGFCADDELIECACRFCGGFADIPAVQIRRELDGIILADKKYGVAAGHAIALGALCRTGALKVILSGAEWDEKFLSSFARTPERLRLTALLCALCGGGDKLSDRERDRQRAFSACRALGYPLSFARRAAEVCSFAAFGGRGEDVGAVRRFLVGAEKYLSDAVALREDCGLTGGGANAFWLRVYKDMLAEGVPFGLKELNVSAKELNDVGFDRAQTGKILQFLLEECAVDGGLNQKERLIRLAKLRFGIK